MFVCAVPFVLIPWFDSFSVLLVLAAILGLGEAVVTSSAAALVADLCREDHLGSAMGTFGLIFDVGHASAPLLAGLLITLTGSQNDYRLSFGLVSILLISAAMAFRVVLELTKSLGFSRSPYKEVFYNQSLFLVSPLWSPEKTLSPAFPRFARMLRFIALS
jgi:MFS family permease